MRRGFTLIELAIGLMIFGLLMAGAMRLNTKLRLDGRDANLAERLADVADAAERYVTDNFADVASSASGGPVAIDFATLRAAGYVGDAASDENSLGQTYGVLVRRPSAGTLEVLTTTTGGEALPPARLAQVAAWAGERGGMVDPGDPGRAVGTGGGWTVDLTAYAGTGRVPGTGHPMVWRAYGSGAVAEYLYRFDVGDPEANTMHTDVIMDHNRIREAADVLLESDMDGDGAVDLRASLADVAQRDTATLEDGETVAKPACRGDDPRVAVAPQAYIFPTPANGLSAHAVNAGDRWEVHLELHVPNPRTPDPTDALWVKPSDPDGGPGDDEWEVVNNATGSAGYVTVHTWCAPEP